MTRLERLTQELAAANRDFPAFMPSNSTSRYNYVCYMTDSGVGVYVHIQGNHGDPGEFRLILQATLERRIGCAQNEHDLYFDTAREAMAYAYLNGLVL